MLQKYSKYRVLQCFFDFPRRRFQVREISRLIGLAQPSVVKHLDELVKGGFVVKMKEGIYPAFKANREGEGFKLYRKMNVIERIYECGLLDYLYDKFTPDSIVLFGSASKGEDIEESDVDLFLQSSEKKLELGKYEKMLNRKIHLIFGESFKRLGDEIKNNILNGIVLKGYVKVF